MQHSFHSAYFNYKTNCLTLTVAIHPAEILVQRCLEGDPSAYRELYDRYARAMYNTSLRILNSTADAEDVLQEAFTDAFQQLAKFEQRSTFGAWIKQIVVYKSIALLKKRRIAFVDMEAGDVAADEPGEENNWYTVDRIRAAIQELPDGYRTVLTLYLFEGFSHEEIADSLGIAHTTARSQYARARQKLLNLLKTRAAYEQ